MSHPNQQPKLPHIEGSQNVTPYSWWHARRVQKLNKVMYERAVDRQQMHDNASEPMTFPEDVTTNMKLIGVHRTFMKSLPVQKAEQARQQNVVKKAFRYGMAAVVASGLFVVEGGFFNDVGESYSSSAARSPVNIEASRTAVFESPLQTVIVMKALGVCADEMRAQATFDHWRAAARLGDAKNVALHAAQEEQAARVLDNAHVACVPVKDAAKQRAFAFPEALGMQTITLSRTEITAYSAISWCSDRDGWKALLGNATQQQTDATNAFIAAGDQAFNAQSCA